MMILLTFSVIVIILTLYSIQRKNNRKSYKNRSVGNNNYYTDDYSFHELMDRQYHRINEEYTALSYGFTDHNGKWIPPADLYKADEFFIENVISNEYERCISTTEAERLSSIFGVRPNYILGLDDYRTEEEAKQKRQAEKEAAARKAKAEAEARKEAERKLTPCVFSPELTQEKFDSIVQDAVRSMQQQIAAAVNGAIVNGTVTSQSDLPPWRFRLDFNDFGRITGNCWQWSENPDSPVPRTLMTHIQNGIYAVIL